MSVELVQFAERPRLGRMVLTDENDIFGNYFAKPVLISGPDGRGILLNPDPIIEQEGEFHGTSVYDEMLDKDNHLAGLVDARTNAFLSLPMEIQPAEDTPQATMEAKFVEEVLLECNGLHDSLRQMRQSVVKGHQIFELDWYQREDGKWGLHEIAHVDENRFVFDVEWRPRLLTLDKPFFGMDLPEKKFLVVRYNARAGNPYGVGIGRSLWWAYFFKKAGIKSWLVFCEKFGLPTVVGKYRRGTPKPDQDKLLQIIRGIAQATGVVVEEGTLIDLLEAQRSGSTTSYKDLSDFLNAEMSKRVVGQTLTTEPGASGSYALGKVHGNVRQDILEADAIEGSQDLQRVVRWIVDYNFGERPASKYPKVVFDASPPEDLKQLAETDDVLSSMGVVFGEKMMRRRYNLPELEPGDTPLERQQSDPILESIMRGTVGARPPRLRNGNGNGSPRPGGTNPAGDVEDDPQFAEGRPNTSRMDEEMTGESDSVLAAGTASVLTEFEAIRRSITHGISSGKVRRRR